MHSKRESATKAGPGRYHKQGHQKASPPKRERRAAIKSIGRRQYLQAVRAQHNA